MSIPFLTVQYLAHPNNLAAIVQAYAFASFLIVLAIVCVWIALPLLQRHQAKEQTSGGEQEAALLSNEEN